YRFVYLLPTWCYFLWNLTSQSPGVHDQGEGSVVMQRHAGLWHDDRLRREVVRLMSRWSRIALSTHVRP
ncbi:hypothetical protein, partial [Streptomyces sp. NPDC056255]|uniref:hypothetical protein n=1 Tax=Streptomyces sp. NPDC056255 TaxID=3345764 RepID=UPI0035DEDF85